MSNGIKLSPKHGVNPTIPCCFWCGQPKNEVALLGRIDREDSEAPMHVTMDYEPCDKCKELIGEGIHVIGATNTPEVENMPPIAGGKEHPVYPTGAFFVAAPQFIERLLASDEEMLERVLEAKVLVMPHDVVLNIIDDFKKFEEAEGELEEDENN